MQPVLMTEPSCLKKKEGKAGRGEQNDFQIRVAAESKHKQQ